MRVAIKMIDLDSFERNQIDELRVRWVTDGYKVQKTQISLVILSAKQH
jgi:hypothetical protein